MASASSSSSSIEKRFKYDVFISFRGEDTRKNFVDHLYHALHHKSILTYKDDERITKGKRISDELITSIQDSRFYIIVFSKNYASSSWCLDELVNIMEECHKTTIHTAYPVFYDVEPTDIRKQSGSVGEAFSKHEKQDSAAKWREALKEAAGLAGWELKNTLDGHEAKFIQKIVETISLELRFIDSSVDGKLIGMESRVKDVVSALQTDSGDVRMIGIKGIGGGGKTTLARAVFDHTSSWFEGKSFVENVREVSKASLSGLKKLQKQVLSDVLNDQRIKVSSVHEGKKMMKNMMCGQKVLVVLDDVDNIEQLEALAGKPDWFKPGSRIIITTRDEQVLVAHRVNLIRDVNLLSVDEAVCLFSRYAFGKTIPIHGYGELSRQVVSYAAGLPLTIRVLGSFLCGKNELEWKDAIDRLKTIPLRETLEKLELSYIGLEEDYKEIFLDIACILKGWIKDEAVKVLESCGFHARNGLRVLEQKSLITISDDDQLGMHDHIEEMGKNIVRRSHPDEPNRHSRLWIQEEIEDILDNDLGTEATRCIKMEMTRDCRLETFIKGLGNMKKLRVLYMQGSGDGTREVHGQCLPKALRYLSWDYYPFESLMKSFQEDHLVGLSLTNSLIERFWKCGERKVLKKLRFLYMTSSIMGTFDLEMIPNIETLNLLDCPHLVELNMPMECSKLKALDLLYCEMLRTLKLAPTPDLQILSLRICHDLVELNMPFRCPKLKSLGINSSKLMTVNLGPTPDLETLSLERCHDLVELNMPFRCPKLKSLNINFSKLMTLNLGPTPDLETLSLEGCHDLLELHMPCPKLKALSLNCSKLRTFNLGLTLDLETLSLEGCHDLLELPDLETLSLERCHDLVELNMPFRCPNLKSLSINFSKLMTLNLGPNPDLETLSIKGCHDLLELHMPCPKLKALSLNCSKLRTLNLGLTLDLETLSLEGCHDLLELHIPFRCPKLKSLNVNFSQLRTFNLESTPDIETLSFERCHDLLELHILRCPKLKSLDVNFSKLGTLKLGSTPNLEKLSLEGCYNILELHMPNECPNLKSLNVNSSKLRTLNLGQTSDLDTLSVENCHHLVEINMPFECSKLKTLNLQYCNMLRTLKLAPTPDLEALSLGRCYDLVELNMPFGCPKLKALNLQYCMMLRTIKLAPTPDLETLNLEGCCNLLEVHMPFRCSKLKSLSVKFSKLRTLNLGLTPDLEMLCLEGCHDLLELRLPNECPNLKSLGVDSSKLRTLNLGSTPDLETLSLKGCHDLLELHMPFRCQNLKALSLNCSKLRTLNMPFGCPKLKSLSISDSKLRTLDLGLTPNLERLDIKDCYDLVELHCPIGCLEKLAYLNLNDCLGFKCFLFEKKIQSPEVVSLHLIAESVDICPLHSDNNLQKFPFSCLYGEPILSSIGNLRKLISVGLCTCTNLKCFSECIGNLQSLRKLTLEGSIPEVPKDLNRLESLEELRLLSKKIQHLPDSICMLTHLKHLKLNSCWLIEKLPEDLGRLECLEDLYLTDCILLRDIPESVCELQRLKCFHLPYCMLVEKLPEELGRLECLKELNIEGAGITYLPQSIFKLEGLRIIGSRWRIQSYGFTTFTSMYPVSQNSSYLVYCDI